MGFQDVLYCANRDQGAVTKRVYYQGTNTLYEGMALCYNHDTTANVSGLTAGVTAEGSQNEGKYFYVEEPSATNMQFPAGVVAKGSWCGTAGPCYLDVFIPNGSIVPIRTNANCVLGTTVLGMTVGSNTFGVVTGDGDPAPMAISMETVDRSGTNGLVLAKLSAPLAAVLTTNAYFAPARPVTTGDFYGVKFDGSAALTGAGAAGPRSWVVGISGDKTAGVLTTSGCDDALLRISGNNYVANEEIYYFRGLNANVSNRSGGVVGGLENLISVSAKSGSVQSTIKGLNVDAQSLSADTGDEFGGLDVSVNREGGVNTKEYGIKVRTRGTINTIMETALLFEKGTDYGFSTLFKADALATIGAYASTSNAPALATGDIMIPIKIGSTTYYLVALQDTGV
jgi:hypothetical protein